MREPEPKDYARRLVKGSAIIFTATILSAVITVFLRAFLGRSLGAAEYGLFYAILVLVSFPTLFYDLGLCKALVKHIPEFSVKKKFGAIKSSVAFVTLIQATLALSIAAVLFIFSGQIALAVFKTEAAVLPLRILCVWFFVEAFYRILTATFQGLQNMLVLALMRFFLDMFILLMAILFISVIGWGVGGVALAYLATTLAVTVFSLAYFKWRYPQVFKAKTLATKPLAKKLFAFAIPAIIASLATIITEYTDTLMIAVFRTLPEVGFYQAAQPTARLLWYFAGTMTTVLIPMISEMWSKREERPLSGALHFLTKFSFVLIIPAALVFIAFPEIIIRLIFGEGYLAGATVLQILSCAAIIYTPFMILSGTMLGTGKVTALINVTWAMTCLNLVGNLLLIPPYGIEGAAVATICSYTLGLVLLFYYAKKFVRFTVPVMPLLKTLAGAVLTLLLIFDLKSILVLPPWPEAFVVIIPSLLFYGVWILATRAITKDDLKMIKEIVPLPKWLFKVASKLVRK